MTMSARNTQVPRVAIPPGDAPVTVDGVPVAVHKATSLPLIRLHNLGLPDTDVMIGHQSPATWAEYPRRAPAVPALLRRETGQPVGPRRVQPDALACPR
jgi:hypothetical protein